MNLRNNKYILVISNPFQAFSTFTPQFVLSHDESNRQEDKRRRNMFQEQKPWPAMSYHEVAQVLSLETNTVIH
jgi:hypothetical protein